MNEGNNIVPNESEGDRVITGDGVIIVMLDDGGDYTVRPPRPVLRKLGLETQAKIAKWQAEEKERQAKEQQDRESQSRQQEPNS